MKWYQVKEQAAGEKRLQILWYIYKLSGKKVVKFLVFFITFFAFLGAKDARRCSKKYLSIIGIKPVLGNCFRHFLSYSNSLLDRMEVFAGTYKPENVVYSCENDRKLLENDLKNGVFFICSHLGNIEIMRAFFSGKQVKNVDIFLSKEQCKIFNSFVYNLEVKTPVTVYPVEDISLETPIEIREKILNGDIVIMAGDRTSKNSTNSSAKFLGQNIHLPLGTFKFAYLMECPIYFVCALNEREKYKIYLKKFIFEGSKQKTLEKMQSEYIEFLESLTKKYPFQFYHFYDFFE